MLPPQSDITDEPTQTVTISQAWLSVIIGLLIELTNEAAWIGSDEERELASERTDELIALLSVGDQ